jgi:SAM-dependent methyltransferase
MPTRRFIAFGVPAMRDARAAAARMLQIAGWGLIKTAGRFQTGPVLAGDRTIEWGWVLSRLRRDPGRVLDFGTGTGFLALAAALAGHEVVAVDLEPCAFEFKGEPITYRQGDFNELEFENSSFDQVLNCSTIEHVGLEGRYGSPADRDGDLRAMEKLARLLRPDGDMVLTLPVGLDGVFPPYHRVYGAERLPRLLEPFSVRDEAWWAKLDGESWEPASRETALAVEPSSSYYALGLFVAAPR